VGPPRATTSRTMSPRDRHRGIPSANASVEAVGPSRGAFSLTHVFRHSDGKKEPGRRPRRPGKRVPPSAEQVGVSRQRARRLSTAWLGTCMLRAKTSSEGAIGVGVCLGESFGPRKSGHADPDQDPRQRQAARETCRIRYTHGPQFPRSICSPHQPSGRSAH